MFNLCKSSDPNPIKIPDSVPQQQNIPSSCLRLNNCLFFIDKIPFSFVDYDLKSLFYRQHNRYLSSLVVRHRDVFFNFSFVMTTTTLTLSLDPIDCCFFSLLVLVRIGFPALTRERLRREARAMSQILKQKRELKSKSPHTHVIWTNSSFRIDQGWGWGIWQIWQLIV